MTSPSSTNLQPSTMIKMAHQQSQTPRSQKMASGTPRARRSQRSSPTTLMPLGDFLQYAEPPKMPNTSEGSPPAVEAKSTRKRPNRHPRRGRRHSQPSPRPALTTTAAESEFQSHPAHLNLPAYSPVSYQPGTNLNQNRLVQFGSRSPFLIPPAPFRLQVETSKQSGALSAKAQEFIPGSSLAKTEDYKGEYQFAKYMAGDSSYGSYLYNGRYRAQEQVPYAMPSFEAERNQYAGYFTGYRQGPQPAYIYPQRRQAWYLPSPMPPELASSTIHLQRAQAQVAQDMLSDGHSSAEIAQFLDFWNRSREQIIGDMLFNGHSPAGIARFLYLVEVGAYEKNQKTELVEESVPAKQTARVWNMTTMEWDDDVKPCEVVPVVVGGK